MPGWPRSIIYKNYVAVVVEEKCQATPLPLKKKKKQRNLENTSTLPTCGIKLIY